MKSVNNICFTAALNELPKYPGIEYEDMGWADGKIMLGVNWAGIGAKDADDTAAFAEALAAAAKAAREFCFNGYVKVYA